MHRLYVHFIFHHHIEFCPHKLAEIWPCTYMHTDLHNVCVGLIIPLGCIKQLITTTTTTTVAVSVSELSLPLPTLISYSLLFFLSQIRYIAYPVLMYYLTVTTTTTITTTIFTSTFTVTATSTISLDYYSFCYNCYSLRNVFLQAVKDIIQACLLDSLMDWLHI